MNYIAGSITLQDFVKGEELNEEFKKSLVQITLDLYNKFVKGKTIHVLKHDKEFAASTSENLFKDQDPIISVEIFCAREMCNRKLVPKLVANAVEKINRGLGSNLFMINTDKDYGVSMTLNKDNLIVELWSSELIYSTTSKDYYHLGSSASIGNTEIYPEDNYVQTIEVFCTPQDPIITDAYSFTR